MKKQCTFINAEDLVQSSPEWHLFRSKGIGASESNVLAGKNKWNTVVDLWRAKTNREIKPFIITPAIQHGIDTEDEAREQFTLATGIEAHPICAISAEYPFIRASLDGLSNDRKIAVEIKCPSALGIHIKTINGTIPEYYYPQLQHQLFVTGASLNCFWSYVQSMGGFMVEVKPNAPYIQELVRRQRMFWKCVEKDIEPIESDYPEMVV